MINATSYFKDGSSKDSVRSLGSKRKFISPEQIEEITKIYGEFEASKVCKIFDNSDFAYHRITVDRPKKDEKGNIRDQLRFQQDEHCRTLVLNINFRAFRVDKILKFDLWK